MPQGLSSNPCSSGNALIYCILRFSTFPFGAPIGFQSPLCAHGNHYIAYAMSQTFKEDLVHQMQYAILLAVSDQWIV